MPFLPILKVNSEKIPERVLVVGDPGRLGRISKELSEASVVAENREYKTMLGTARQHPSRRRHLATA